MTLTDLLAWPAAGAGTESLAEVGRQSPTGTATPADTVRPATDTGPAPASPVPTASTAPAARPVLETSGLSVRYPGAVAPAIRDIDLSLAPGGTLAIVGESGSGKSTTAAALTGLLPAGTVVHADTHSHLGEDLLGARPRTWRRILGTGIAYVPQDAGAGLNPVRTIASALAESLTVNGYGRREIPDRIAEVLASVGLDAAEHGRRHPHELSGGQRQRVLIANALAAEPALIIADEPTSALDATVQKQVLDVLSDRVSASGTGLILITHDLGVAAERAAELAVMRNGRIVETGPTAQVLAAPAQEYTRDLLAAAPHLGGGRLSASAGTATALVRMGTVLRADGITRSFGGSRAAVDGVDIEVRAGRTLGIVGESGSGAAAPGTSADPAIGTSAAEPAPVIGVEDLSLTVARGTTHGIVGESGSGKSTTARILLGAETPDSGSVDFHGSRLDTWNRRELGRRIRYVHQDSTAALDPRYTVERILGEPLRGHRIGTKADRASRISALLTAVALDESLLRRTPRELSGGQRQRLAIARAIAVDPEVVILDEPVSALDVGVQAQVLQLLVDLQARLGLSLVVISHDLAVIEQVADDVVVMHEGRVVEAGPAAQVLAEARDPYTRTLLAAVPRLPEPPRTGRPADTPTTPSADTSIPTTPSAPTDERSPR